MKEKNLSKEIILVFEYIRDTLSVDYPNILTDEYAYIYSILLNENSLAYQALSSVVIETTLNDMKEFFRYNLSFGGDELSSYDYSIFDKYFDNCDNICKDFGAEEITSTMVLLSILNNHEDIKKKFKDYLITPTQIIDSIKNNISATTTAIVKVPKKHQKKKKNEVLEMTQPIKVISGTYNENSEIERSCFNITKLATMGKVKKIIGYDKYYNDIFAILSKKYKNNVVVSGRSGVGKTATIWNLANIISEKKCNKSFHNKILVELDFSKLVVGTPFKGAFEQKFYSIINEAKESGNYIFFIDNLQLLLNGNTKYAETDIESLLISIMSEPSIQVISTINPKGLSSLLNKSLLGKYVQDITIEEPTIDETINILHHSKVDFEKYHDVIYEDDAISSCVELCKKYVTNRSLPDSALDLLDAVGATVSLGDNEEDPILKGLRKELKAIINEIEDIKKTSETKEYNAIDELTKRQIFVKSQIAIKEKEEILSKVPKIIKKNDVCSVLSNKIDVPLDEMTKDEKTRLKGLSDKIKENVIGQDEAIDEVCRAVKRQRVGLGENERPAVLMFLGSTGTGKTYLAKKLAEEVFGDEKYFVRIDMGEYSDKTSVNKIYGSAPGYVGHEETTPIVQALKEHKNFVLLLDEFEKADESVHNAFLNVFDEGRFTDNHGEEYSLKDVIIILTSNVGVAEAMNRGRAIGFGNGDFDMSQTIIEKELKKKFKPEFLNRIQKIVFFNKLNDDNLKSIVKLEVNKINNKVEKLGYYLSEEIRETKMIDVIYDEIIKNKDYGARPIVNEVQRKIEDRIVDYIIENDVQNGHTFTFNELYK